jgi:hypothetical protein
MNMTYLTASDVTGIYGAHAIDTLPGDAAHDAAEINGKATSREDAERLAHLYAQQLRAEWEGDMNEAAAFEAA